MNDKVSIIILNYNGKQYLEECLNSVFMQTYTEFELILFDNASSDGSIEFLKDKFNDSRLKIISSKQNLGFAGGNNEALKHTSNEIIVLLNNDTTVNADWLDKLVNAAASKNTVASSFVITEGISEIFYQTNGSLSYMMYNIMNIFPDFEDVFYPNGASCIFRKSEIGIPFDTDYFFYGEDVYLGLKARFMNMNIRFVKDSVVYHKGGGTESNNSFKTFCRERNRFLNLYLFFSPWFIIRMLPYITFNHITKTIVSVYSKKYSLIGTIKAYLWFYVNIPGILKKRKSLMQFKTADEKEIIKFLSSKVFNGNNTIEKLINNISYFYSRLTGIKPIEYFLKKK
ncbi:MAG: glycosyltransferase family 2 protein [Ignavibacteria bacterium]|nr:glycosyltransferase family 2 protein [Ignavibacteria bacterium]